jgi:hypothetical protein
MPSVKNIKLFIEEIWKIFEFLYVNLILMSSKGTKCKSTGLPRVAERLC